MKNRAIGRHGKTVRNFGPDPSLFEPFFFLIFFFTRNKNELTCVFEGQTDSTQPESRTIF